MSLALLQGYSSAEEEEEGQPQNDDARHHESSDDDDDDEDESSAAVNRSIADRSLFDRPQPNASGLPSAFDAFSEVGFFPVVRSSESIGWSVRDIVFFTGGGILGWELEQQSRNHKWRQTSCNKHDFRSNTGMCLWWRVKDLGGMSDLCLYELEDNVWDEFGESDDHIVPHPGNKQGDQSSIEGDRRKKPQSEVIGVTDDADTSTKYRVLGKEKRNIQPVTNNTTMLEKGPWSHTPDGVFPSCDTDSTKGVTSIASDDTRISSHSFKSVNVESGSYGFCADDPIMGDECTADDNSLYRYPLSQMPQSGNDLSFFDNDREDKDNGDLLYYGWPDIGNFEDVDRMFRSCDSTFGIESSLNNDEELCWFSSSAPKGSEDALTSGLKISSQNASSSKGVSDHHAVLKSDNEDHSINGSNKKNISVGNKMSSQSTDFDDPAAFGHASFLNVDSKSEGGNISMPKEQRNFGKKQSKHHYQLEGEREGQYLENGSSFHQYDTLKQITDMKHPRGDLSCQVYTTPGIQQHKQSAGPGSMTYVPRQYMQLDYPHHSDQISVCPTPSGTKSENNSCTSPSLKESSYASNQLQSMESSLGPSMENPALVRSGKSENIQSCQGFQSSFTRNFENATTKSPMVFCGTLPNQKQVQPSENQIEDQTDVEGACIKLPAELDSSNVQESSCMSPVLDDISLEATSFRQLQQVMEKLDVRTKLCIRDSLYRLARSAEQRHNCANQRGIRDDGDASGALMVEETNKCTGFMDMETDTNPIDRSIAHLLFHRPLDPSRVPSNETLSLRSHALIHESVSSPLVTAEKQVCQEETAAGGKKETLITDDG